MLYLHFLLWQFRHSILLNDSFRRGSLPVAQVAHALGTWYVTKAASSVTVPSGTYRVEAFPSYVNLRGWRVLEHPNHERAELLACEQAS